MLEVGSGGDWCELQEVEPGEDTERGRDRRFGSVYFYERDGRERWRKEIYWTVEVVVQTEIPKREVVHWLVERKPTERERSPCGSISTG